MARPTSRTRSTSHEAASDDSVGKHVAGTLVPRPITADSMTLRRPVGPSESQMEGMPSRSIG